MNHTYLRYSCADSFGLTVAAASSKAPAVSHILSSLDHNTVVTVAGSQVACWRNGSCQWKWGHDQQRNNALNDNELVCLDTVTSQHTLKLATGWVDGSVRVVDMSSKQQSATRSLLNQEQQQESQQQPLVLQGHSSAVRVVVLERKDDTPSRLLSGGSDGTIIVWDLVTETGLFRLLGHKGSLSDVAFVLDNNNKEDVIVSCCSGDGLIKVWDLTTQSCTQTLASTHQATASLYHVFSNNRARLVSGGVDGKVRVWSVRGEQLHNKMDDDSTPLHVKKDDDDMLLQSMGTVLGAASVVHEKVTAIRVYKQRHVGVLHAHSKTVDVYRIRSVSEAQKKRQRRIKRRQEKQKKQAAANENNNEPKGRKRGILDDDSEEEMEQTTTENEKVKDDMDRDALCASDEFEYLGTVRASHKIRSFCFLPKEDKQEVVRIMCALSTNALETHSLVLEKDEESANTKISAQKTLTMDFYGHPTGIRSVALSSDDRFACTVSKNVTKIWNVSSRSCIQSLSPELNVKSKGCYGLCCVFLPGNTHVVMGTREGHLVLIDIAAGDVVFVDSEAHEGAIWSIDIQPQALLGEGAIRLVTGSADKNVKFWEIECQDREEGATGTPQPMLVHTRTLAMTDDVIAVRYSKSTDPRKRLVIVSTLDSTIKVLFDDSLKLFLSLYGHKLPALAIDCSDDNSLLASSGADKTVKVWGLDFGDTHRTLHGHEDSVTDLRFVRRTHNFFTASKDGSVRYWDGDRFEQILLLNGHFAEVNCLAMSKTGAFVLSAGMDRQVRVWERTQDIVFLEEERELELENMFDRINDREQTSTSRILSQKQVIDDDDEAKAEEPQSEAAVRRSVTTVAAGDRLLEALERADQEMKEIAAYKSVHGTQQSRPPNMLMISLEPAPYMLWVLRTIKSVELDQCLVMLSIRHVERLLYYLVLLLRKGQGIELCSRVAVFAVKTHQNQVIACKSMSPLLRELKGLLRSRLSEARDVAGYDMAALKLITKAAREKRESFLTYNEQQTKDIWADLGVGRDVASSLEGRAKRKETTR